MFDTAFCNVRIRGLRLLALAALGGLSVSACASVTPAPLASGYGAPQPQAYAADRSAPTAPRPSVGRAKIGAPYQAGGVWYVPAAQPDYNAVGLASWYGDQYNGKPTANGETFDVHAATAAHATLPMPCMVEVTNLDNGRSLLVRVNDRGPFHSSRIIDVSRGAAEQLGFLGKGSAHVRVRYAGPAPLVGTDTLTYAANGAEPNPPPFARETDTIVPPPSPLMRSSAMATARSLGFAYAIQAGAFSERGRAEHAAAQLAAAGKADIRPLDRRGVRLYRVTVGHWADAATAGAALGRVTALGFDGARVVPAA